MLLKRPKRPAFGYRFALLTQIRDFLDSPCAGMTFEKKFNFKRHKQNC
jgi:hypothetical protein